MKKATIKNAVYNCTFYVTVLLVSYFSAAEAKAENPEWMFLPEFLSTTSLFDDGEYMWIGTNYFGTYKLHKETFKVVDSVYPNGNDIKIDKNGVVWVANNGGITSYDGKKEIKHDFSKFFSYNVPMIKIEIDKDNNIWTLADDNGILKYDGNDWTHYNNKNTGVPINENRDFKFDKDGVLWICTTKRGLVLFDGSEWKIMDSLNSGLPGNYIYCIEMDDSNNIWLGINNVGLVKYDRKNWTIYNKNNSILPINVVTVIKYSKSTLWFGSHQSYFNYGLIRYDGFNWKLFTESNSGLKGNMIMSIEIDKKENVWIGSNSTNLDKRGLNIYREGGVILDINGIVSKDKLSIAPNPVFDRILIDNTGYYGTKYTITNLFGREVLSGQIQTSFIDVNHLSSGIYFLRLLNESNLESIKFLKE